MVAECHYDIDLQKKIDSSVEELFGVSSQEEFKESENVDNLKKSVSRQGTRLRSIKKNDKPAEPSMWVKTKRYRMNTKVIAIPEIVYQEQQEKVTQIIKSQATVSRRQQYEEITEDIEIIEFQVSIKSALIFPEIIYESEQSLKNSRLQLSNDTLKEYFVSQKPITVLENHSEISRSVRLLDSPIIRPLTDSPILTPISESSQEEAEEIQNEVPEITTESVKPSQIALKPKQVILRSTKKTDLPMRTAGKSLWVKTKRYRMNAKVIAIPEIVYQDKQEITEVYIVSRPTLSRVQHNEDIEITELCLTNKSALIYPEIINESKPDTNQSLLINITNKYELSQAFKV